MEKYFIAYTFWESNLIYNVVTECHPVQFLLKNKKVDDKNMVLIFWERLPEDLALDLTSLEVE